ncbi:MAG: septum formation inhibitor Maf [Rhodocyclaceae bacterium]|nr:septum formation inhibitor Maf [Rhodocyclaceae bacterium]
MTRPAFYLASSSPRRRELLLQAGYAPAVLRIDPQRAVDETPVAGEPPLVYVKRLAHAKALAGVAELLASGLEPAPVLGADTTVALGAEIFGKPADADEAVAILSRLSGREHQVLTAVALAEGERVDLRISVSRVRFARLGPAEIRAYAQTGEPLDKAGAYGIQGRAACFVERLEGSYSGVMGLPLFETADLLAQSGIVNWKRDT